MCAALTAERVQAERGFSGCGPERSRLWRVTHALSTAVQRGSQQSGGAAKKRHHRRGCSPRPPGPTGRRAASFHHLRRYIGTQRRRGFFFFVYLVDAMWDDSSEGKIGGLGVGRSCRFRLVWFGTFQGRCKVAQRTLNWRFRRCMCKFIVLVSLPFYSRHRQ